MTLVGALRSGRKGEAYPTGVDVCAPDDQGHEIDDGGQDMVADGVGKATVAWFVLDPVVPYQIFGEHDGERVCEAGLRRGVRSRPR